jgi:hypothetical protein
MKRNHRSLLLIPTLVLATLTACSSSDTVPGGSSSSVPAEVTVVPEGADPRMGPLCDQMIADASNPEDAAALAESEGFTSRIGTIDGEPQAVTMDYRLDRFTFTIDNGVVTDCVIG